MPRCSEHFDAQILLGPEGGEPATPIESAQRLLKQRPPVDSRVRPEAPDTRIVRTVCPVTPLPTSKNYSGISVLLFSSRRDSSSPQTAARLPSQWD